jgi:subtilase family serine protease
VGDQGWEEGEHTRRGRFCAFGILGAALAVTSTVGLALGAAAPAGAAYTPMRALYGNDAPVPPGATPIGPASTTDTLPLVVTLQPQDPAALSAYAQAVSDPTSPDYRHFLTPSQFATQFGATSSTVAAVTSALRAEGLSVGAPSALGLSVPVTGTVGQEESAFSTPITQYKLSSGKTGFHNDSEPKVPTTVAPQIEGVLGLDTLNPPQPQVTAPQASPGVARPGAQASSSPALAPGQPTPQSGSCASTISSLEGDGALDAPDLAQAYSFGSLYDSDDYGAGTTIALLEMYGAGYSSTDITDFADCYGITLANGQVSEVNVSSGDGAGTEGGGTVESELDIETALSLAPKADIEVYEGGTNDSIYSVLNAIESQDTAKIVSVSWTNGCEAYVGTTEQDAEYTLLQAAATEGQSVFVAAGDQGSEGCNVNGVTSASTRTKPVAQAVDPSTGTLYVANESSNTVTVDGEGDGGDNTTAGSVSTGSSPDAVALDATDGKVFVANSSSSTPSLTEFATSTCNDTTTTGCGSPTTISSGGHLSTPRALAVSGSTLYVANGNGTVAVYNGSTNTYEATVTLLSGTVPTAVAVDATNGYLYVADGSNTRVEYFDDATCNATTTSGCSGTPGSVSVGTDPDALAVDESAGGLYVANGGGTGGISVVSLATHAVTTTISTTDPAGSDGTGVVSSIGLSPDGDQVLAILHDLSFPGDVMATINTSTNTIAATANLQTETDTMGQLVSDGASSRDYVWVTDENNASQGCGTGAGGCDVLENLSLAVSDPAAQPYVTAVGGTSLSNTSLGPPPTETTWNDQLNYSEGAGGGGISQTFDMPSYQQSYGGVVTGSSGTPCANSGGYCREVPDVSADADPNTGYIIYDSVNGLDWNILGGTSGAAPLWAAVTAVAASSKDVTVGFGNVNPVLYYLAQKSPGTYFNDVTTGSNDFNATAGGAYTATTGYDMATGLGTPVTSELASGLTTIFVAVTGSQTYGSSTPTFAGSDSPPSGITVNTSYLTCTTVGASTTIGPTLSVGSYTLLPTSCSGATLSGTNSSNYSIAYTSAANDFTVNAAPVNVAVSGSQTYGGSPTFSGTPSSPPSGITVNTAGLTCTTLEVATTIAPTVPVSSNEYTLVPNSCTGVTLSGTNSSDYAVNYTTAAKDFVVNPASLTITASNGTMTYGGTVPTITVASYSGFVNGQNQTALTTQPTCATTATSQSPVSASPQPSSCGDAADPNYTIGYVGGSVTISPAPLTITASSPSMAYGSTPPAITPNYAGFVNSDNSSNLTTQPTCSTTATNSSPVSPPTYPSSCTGAADSNYTIGYVGGSVTVTAAPIDVDVSGSQTYGGSATFSASDSPPSGITVDTAGVTCATVGSSTAIGPTLAVATSPYTILGSSCSGASLSGTNSSDYSIVYVGTANAFVVSPAPLQVTASNGTMDYGGTVPTITPSYAGFVNGQNASAFTSPPTCSTTALSTSNVGTYPSSCSGTLDPNYAFTYVAGQVTVTPAPLNVAVSGTQPNGGTPTFSGAYSAPSGVTVDASGLTCTTVQPSTPISPSLASGQYTLVSTTCSGVTLGGSNGSNYAVDYTSAANDFSVGTPLPVAVSGSQTYGGSPTFSGNDTAPSGVTVDTSGLTCTTVGSSTPIAPTLAAGSDTLFANSCSGVTLSGPNAGSYTVQYTSASNDFTVDPAPLTITASGGTMMYGGTPPTITPQFSGFVNGQGSSVLTAQPSCGTSATSTSHVADSPYGSSCSGAAGANYAVSYSPGSVTVTPAPLQITASSVGVVYGSPAPAITPDPTGFVNGDSLSDFTTQPTCSSNYSGPPSPSSVAGSPYTSSCSGGSDPDYSVTYLAGSVTVAPDPVDVAVSGSQTYGGSPTFTSNPGTPPSGIGVSGSVRCTKVDVTTTISSTLASGAHTIYAPSCSGLSLSGTGTSNYVLVYTSATDDFMVNGDPPAPPAPAPPPSHGYWLVGSDGGIFTFGSANFYGSTGNIRLQRPVVGITPTQNKAGYWLVASDGGIFAFGNAGFYGSIPGQGLHPAGSGLQPSLNAPIVGMVPSANGGGYFMVASDGGVFAFGDARFEGSCPGIGGCAGAAVAVVPDASGNGYWLVTQTGHVYAFGDAAAYGAPGPQAAAVTSAVRTSDGNGYYILLADGSVFAYGDAVGRGGPSGVGGLDPASAIFTDSGGGGYWVSTALGAVYTYGDAPDDGSMAGTTLNGAIIAATGF